MRVIVFSLTLIALSILSGCANRIDSGVATNDVAALSLNLSSEQHVALLERQLSLSDAAFSRFENYIGGFGILIGVVVLVFGLNTRSAAILAARKEMQTEVNDLREMLRNARQASDASIASLAETQRASQDRTTELFSSVQAKAAANDVTLEALTKRLETHLAEAETSLKRLRELLAEADRHAEQIAMRAVSHEPPLSTAEQNALAAATQGVLSKPAVERTGRDLLTLLAASAEAKNWEQVRILARDINPDESELMRSSSIYYRAVGSFYGGKFIQALDGFRQIITSFADAADPSIKLQYAASQLNVGIALNNLKRFDETIKHLEGVARPPVDDDSRFIQIDARTRQALAFALDEEKDYLRAIKILSTVIADFRSSEDPLLVEAAGLAAYNQACAYTKLNCFDEAVASLSLTRELGVALTVDGVCADEDLASLVASDSGKAMVETWRNVVV